ncbi:microtubule integrity protein mal3 [Fusarium falciforme]|nr:microtubule integrity protein mal3 [Fusarium falciforme]
MGESRQELVAWLNSLLQLNITKVEQCGTGAALCQVFDSIYMDVPMSKVKFNVNSEYLYIQNFKVLQNCFLKHQIDKPIPVSALVKCKMQDNLEFLQWTKRFWDLNFPDHEYDAVARRKGGAMPPAGGAAPPIRRFQQCRPPSRWHPQRWPSSCQGRRPRHRRPSAGERYPQGDSDRPREGA